MSEVTESILGIMANIEDKEERVSENLKLYFIGGLYPFNLENSTEYSIQWAAKY